MQEKMELWEVLEHTYRILSGINVPAGLIQQIGIPISQALGNIGQCIEAMRKAKEQEQEKDEERAIREEDL